jgi:hypothetical protein
MKDGFAELVHREEWRFRDGWMERLWAHHIRILNEREASLLKQHVELAFVNDLLTPPEPELTRAPIYTITMLDEVFHEPHKPKAGPKAGSW